MAPPSSAARAAATSAAPRSRDTYQAASSAARPTSRTERDVERERRARKEREQREKEQEREAKPSGRLATEKRREHRDPAEIGPWILEKLVGQGASGEFIQ